MEMPPAEPGVFGAIGSLAEPTRRALYEYVARSDDPVGRDEAAHAVGIGRSLAAFHLDRLVEVGLLVVEYRRLTARSGPGAGRPAKLYARAPATIEASLPARRYEAAATILATAVTESLGEHGGGGAVMAALREAGRAYGRTLGEAAGRGGEREIAGDGRARVLAALAAGGFEPEEDGPDRIRVRNCPFEAAALANRTVVCGMNLALVSGLLDAIPEAGLAAVELPETGRCCVEVVRAR